MKPLEFFTQGVFFIQNFDSLMQCMCMKTIKLKKGDFVRIDLDSVPNPEGLVLHVHEALVQKKLGLNPGRNNLTGNVVSVNGTDVLYTDWAGMMQIVIPEKHLKLEIPTDVEGTEIKSGDTVWVVVKNKQCKCKMVKVTKFKHLGYGFMELGVQFEKQNGKKFSQYHPKSRIKIS